MLYILEIQRKFNCTFEMAEEIFDNMSGLGFDFSECSQEEFDVTATEVFQFLENSEFA